MAFADGKRMIAISDGTLRFVDETMSLDLAHGDQDARISNTSTDDLLEDHPFTLGREAGIFGRASVAFE